VIGAEGFKEAFGSQIEAALVAADQDLLQRSLRDEQQVEIHGRMAQFIAYFLDDKLSLDFDIMVQEIFRQQKTEIRAGPVDGDENLLFGVTFAFEGDIIRAGGSSGPGGIRFGRFGFAVIYDIDISGFRVRIELDIPAGLGRHDIEVQAVVVEIESGHFSRIPVVGLFRRPGGVKPHIIKNGIVNNEITGDGGDLSLLKLLANLLEDQQDALLIFFG